MFIYSSLNVPFFTFLLSCYFFLGEEEFDDLLTNQDFPFLDRTFELKLKEDYGSDISSF